MILQGSVSGIIYKDGNTVKTTLCHKSIHGESDYMDFNTTDEAYYNKALSVGKPLEMYIKGGTFKSSLKLELTSDGKITISSKDYGPGGGTGYQDTHNVQILQSIIIFK